MCTRARHWDTQFGSREEEDLTWYEGVPEVSLELVTKYAEPGDPIIDVGGGTARLADVLLSRGYGPVTVLDVSEAALSIRRNRLGELADNVTWICADITRWIPAEAYFVWHDRAVFHFLTQRADRIAYVAAMSAALPPDGVAIIATFADDGPIKCSGLPVVRYSPAQLSAELQEIAPDTFRVIEARRHVHITPKGDWQSFQFTVFKKSVPE